ncbi:BgTH12-03506 [Blumeria graminis f. sp. triticale]|nr:BgTH12-03506 [Blumeria graminis f. sp. triticale]
MMSTSLVAQLSAIAANSENALNLKAQKTRHSKSLLFDPRTAASQSFEILYAICYEGFQELCLLDNRFFEFQHDLFSENSQEKNRSLMSKAQNLELNSRLESFLGLVGSRLRLAPAIKAVEWLIRRFRVHENNTSFVLLTFLPYHTLPIFSNLLSILPDRIPLEFKYLQPYIRSLTLPKRHTVVQAAINHAQFLSAFDSYVIQMCNTSCHYPALLSFWAGIMTEAVSGLLDKARSGRKVVEDQNCQDVMIRILPTLNHGFSMKKVPDFRVGCYMLVTVIASKSQLDEKLITTMMEAIVHGWTDETIMPGLVCLSVLAQYRVQKQLTKKVIRGLMKDPKISNALIELSRKRNVEKLTNGLCLALIDRLQKSMDTSGLSFIQQAIQNALLNEAQTINIVKSLILVAYQLESFQTDVRVKMATLLVALMELSGPMGSIVQSALKEIDIDVDELELKLHISMRPQLAQVLDGIEIEKTTQDETIPDCTMDVENILKSLPNKTDEISFLWNNPSQLYQDLYQAFLLCASDDENRDKFDQIPILSKSSMPDNALYLSFYMRIWCGPNPISVRVSALEMTTRYLSADTSKLDFQAIIPYSIAMLSDPHTKVRRGAANLLLVLSQLAKPFVGIKKLEKVRKWGVDNIHNPKFKDDMYWMPTDVAARLIIEVITPVLEECVLDKDHIETIFQKTLNSASSHEISNNHDQLRLSQSSRVAILSFLASQILSTPLLTVKLKLLASANKVRSVGSLTRTKVLLPALQNWSYLSTSEAIGLCEIERLELTIMEEQFLMSIAANEEGIIFISSLIKGNMGKLRPTLIKAVFGRLEMLWPSLKNGSRCDIADVLLAASEAQLNKVESSENLISEAAADFLHKVPLSTEILLRFLNSLFSYLKLIEVPPATKRRRTSHKEAVMASNDDTKLIESGVLKTTFILQLVDDSGAEKHLELLKPLFDILAEIQNFKILAASELAYLQGLVLGSLLAILKAYRENQKLKLDCSSIRADLLVDCIQKTTSLQTQNIALLLISCLAEIAPHLVLHSVMPIFTFIGSSMLQQNDEYSSYVINQTIRGVIPPLVASLRKEKQNPATSAAKILLSFVVAYEHVPFHRRKGLFLSLIQTLGPEDFLHAFLAILVDKYGCSESIKDFAAEIFVTFSVDIELQATVKYIELIKDVLSPNPTYSSLILDTVDEINKSPNQVAVAELNLLSYLLSRDTIVLETGKMLANDDMEAARIRQVYSTLLEHILALADTSTEHKLLRSACGDALESIMNLLSTSEFVKSVKSLLDQPNELLKRKILRSLEARIDAEGLTDNAAREAMLGFMPQLTAIIRESLDVRYKYTAIACVDKISKKYGKKDLEAVAIAAETVASHHCLGQPDIRLRVMALLSLASLLDILKESCISILPIAIPKALDYLKESLQIISEASKLQNACYAFFNALAQHLPYMISGVHLSQFLSISSAAAGLDVDDTKSSRAQCLSLVAKQMDPKILFRSWEQNWMNAISLGPLAIHEYLQILGIAIDHKAKIAVTRNSSIIANIFKDMFDVRRQVITDSDKRFSKECLLEIESEINEIAIRIIYKFNDTTFRPIFTDLVEWSTEKLPSKFKDGQILRQQSLYCFMAMFFGKIKSIVTSYASYLIENSVKLLNSVDQGDVRSKELWSRVLQTLTQCFEHDQDEFWQSPSHFDAIAPVLVAQISNAQNLPIIQELVPTIVELASAADSADHHRELNISILKHLKSQSSSVRLAAVKCEQELTDRLGEEWLSMLPEMLPYISELQEDDDELVEKETHRWIVKIEEVLGESLDSMLQ